MRRLASRSFKSGFPAGYRIDKIVKAGTTFAEVSGDHSLLLILENVLEQLDLPFVQHGFNELVPLVRLPDARKCVISSRACARLVVFVYG
ncbi:hypothetical protein [Puia dinghuensis]|uniref:hypothetical protein n=1 Tax=Puia dinghuensis TaxID=1792502 RepID=UPI00166A569D|nr:hypothetical protein [Puia dinghuensis]